MDSKRALGVVLLGSFVLGISTVGYAGQAPTATASKGSEPQVAAGKAAATDPPGAAVKVPVSGDTKGTEPGQGIVTAPVKVPVKPAAKPPEKVGFARVVTDWPKWLTVTMVDRVRMDSIRAPGVKGADYDGYGLNRFRLTVAARVKPWFQATVQAQDARVGGFALPNVPTSVLNTLNVRLASVELGKKAPRGVTAIVGRQEMTFGDGRLMASPDWGNVSRTYDGARVAAVTPGLKVELFGAAPVDVTTSGVWLPKKGERVYGGWMTLDKVKPLGYAEVYSIAKFNAVAVGETLTRGDQAVFTTGFRLGGPIGKSVTWEADTAVQRGHSAADGISGWGTHEGVAWTIGKSAMKPKLGAEYNYASGDRNAKDGVKRTFDQLYSSTHTKWGMADQIGWRNMQHVAVKFEVSPTKKLKINTAINHLSLATVADAWYGAAGAKVVTNRKATSRQIGWEPDAYASYAVTKDLTVGAGLAVLFAGDFVRQSTDVERLWAPYLMFTCKF